MSCNAGEKHFSRIPDTDPVELLTGKEKWANLLRSLGETKAKKYYLAFRIYGQDKAMIDYQKNSRTTLPLVSRKKIEGIDEVEYIKTFWDRNYGENSESYGEEESSSAQIISELKIQNG